MKIRIDNKKCRDTGVVLGVFLGALFFYHKFYLLLGIPALLFALAFFARRWLYPIAWLWFGLAHLLSSITTPVILTLFYLLFIFPLGIFFKITGRDDLNLKSFKKGRQSVLVEREHLFVATDLEKPFR